MNIVIIGAGLVGTTLYHCALLRNPTDFASNPVPLLLVP